MIIFNMIYANLMNKDLDSAADNIETFYDKAQHKDKDALLKTLDDMRFGDFISNLYVKWIFHALTTIADLLLLIFLVLLYSQFS